MILTLILLVSFPALPRSSPRCSPTVFYRNCWLRHFPGVLIDLPLSMSRGAHLVNYYHAKTARHCSRTCCQLENATCNTAVFSFAESQDGSNCFHLNCPSPDSCIMRRMIDFTLFNVTRGEDPDLLVFENRRDQPRQPNLRKATDMVRFNNSGYLGLDTPSQGTLSTSNWDVNGSSPSRTQLLFPSDPVSVADSRDIGRGANGSRSHPSEGLEAPAFLQGERLPPITLQPSPSLITETDERSSDPEATPHPHSLGRANSTLETNGKNLTVDRRTTVAPRQVDREGLRPPLFLFSAIVFISVCALARRKKKRRGCSRPPRLGKCDIGKGLF
ncbi:uncharacterized protein [Narcine bancroftii]|uniref:uncharacterized protein n=1 Tax=Narcine bancroftii TaxID=1343680 RepID=UPI003831D313